MKYVITETINFNYYKLFFIVNFCFTFLTPPRKIYENFNIKIK